MTSSTPSIADVLKGTALFSALSDAELESLATRTLIRSYASGELLFSEGAPCTGFYIVFKGRVRIFKISSGGREPSELLFIARKDFRALCIECPEIALKVLQVAGARLRRTDVVSRSIRAIRNWRRRLARCASWSPAILRGFRHRNSLESMATRSLSSTWKAWKQNFPPSSNQFGDFSHCILHRACLS